ncbi:LuxR family transcriptional regulator [Burkholderia sp. MSMB2042]|uniref:LuxR family transcriptional regulator n=1 Tax=Burkholderia savannae TaxID=1637837 RepID=A0ABR5T8W1_9BURK|nr:LuxR family transcriptional regulator [Burkholderia savannae]KVG48279.1 LuxR family transcriptional regulator [Burkholderia sp. MSMB0265]KVG84356.1 LuxR family transcriptional regulator [Burkholderia sp. MSMB2040]KVG92191.1 LuxR family transcriptional regulator [Burkholderia sp. MSMB2042]KVG93932.1 LuxR family transcriptional regulator [Burkholderia sp. MSMB2041]KVK76176.1 LuxR family transcriptional regulator [Burkholderia sp. MSMB1498]
MIGVAIFDATPDGLASVRHQFEGDSDIEIAWESDNEATLLSDPGAADSQVLVVSTIGFSRLHSQFVSLVKQQYPELSILVVSATASEEQAAYAFSAGVSGFVGGFGRRSDFVEALRIVADGGKYVSLPQTTTPDQQGDAPSEN